LHYHPSATDHCNISDATRYLIGTYDKQLYTFFDKYDIFDKYDNQCNNIENIKYNNQCLNGENQWKEC